MQVWQSSEGGCSEAKRGASCPVSMVSMVSFLLPWGPAACTAPVQEETGRQPCSPPHLDLLQLLRSMCLNAKVTRPSVFEALWGTAAPSLGRCRVLAASVLAADSRSSLPSKDPSLILRKQELKI